MTKQITTEMYDMSVMAASVMYSLRSKMQKDVMIRPTEAHHRAISAFVK